MPNGYYFFPGDYLRDTTHLGWYEDLAYRRLIDLYYVTGKALRNDRAYLLRAVRASEPEQQAAVDLVLSEFFDLRPDGWHNNRCDERLQAEIARSEGGKRGAAARWHGNKDLPNGKPLARQRQANAPYPTLPYPVTTKEPSVPCRASPAAAREILAFLNAKTGRQYKPVKANLSLIQARLGEGFSADDIRSVVAMKCEQWKGDEKMREYLRPATLFGRTNFAQYQGQLLSEE